ncbi:MAG: response regulator [candidate division Zixibacteria bacterium]|nr:response regulator [candidate division Zixibacteria bacterium]
MPLEKRSKEDKQLKSQELLIVDDELLIRDLLFDYFNAKGYKVHLAKNGKKALEIIGQIEFQVALIDLKMPRIDGVELATLLNKKKPDVAVVIMTAYPTAESAMESMRCGVYDYIAKPFNMEELYMTIKRAFDEHQFSLKSRSKTQSLALNEILKKLKV